MEPDAARLRTALVDRLVADGYIRSRDLEEAFRHVPRHTFLPGTSVRETYQNKAIPLKTAEGTLVSSSSQPSIMALMLEGLQVVPGSRILEVGTGSGYNAAIMSRLAGEAGRIVTIDIDDDVTAHARAALRKAGTGSAEVVRGDGGFGYAAAAPYDGIIVTATAADVTPAWWDQLALGGRLLIPLSIGGAKQLVAFVKKSAGVLRSTSVTNCAFVDLRGAYQDDRETHLRSDRCSGCRMTVRSPELEASDMFALLGSARFERPLPLAASVDDVLSGLSMWLALSEPNRFVKLHVDLNQGRPDVDVPVVWHNVEHAFTYTLGLADRHALSFLHLADALDASGSSAASIVSYGDARALNESLSRCALEWVAQGRPASRSMNVTATRPSETVHAAGGAFSVALPHTTLDLRFSP